MSSLLRKLIDGFFRWQFEILGRDFLFWGESLFLNEVFLLKLMSTAIYKYDNTITIHKVLASTARLSTHPDLNRCACLTFAGAEDTRYRIHCMAGMSLRSDENIMCNGNNNNQTCLIVYFQNLSTAYIKWFDSIGKGAIKHLRKIGEMTDSQELISYLYSINCLEVTEDLVANWTKL